MDASALVILDSSWLGQLLAIERQSFPRPWSRELFLDEFRKSYSVIFGLVEQSTLIAYNVSNIIGDDLHILSIAVHPSRRRLGLGRALLRKVIAEAAQRGLHQIHLEVRASNSAAISLYQDAGFCEVGRRRGYYSDNGEDALLFTLSLVSLSPLSGGSEG